MIIVTSTSTSVSQSPPHPASRHLIPHLLNRIEIPLKRNRSTTERQSCNPEKCHRKEHADDDVAGSRRTCFDCYIVISRSKEAQETRSNDQTSVPDIVGAKENTAPASRLGGRGIDLSLGTLPDAWFPSKHEREHVGRRGL